MGVTQTLGLPPEEQIELYAKTYLQACLPCCGTEKKQASITERREIENENYIYKSDVLSY